MGKKGRGGDDNRDDVMRAMYDEEDKRRMADAQQQQRHIIEERIRLREEDGPHIDDDKDKVRINDLFSGYIYYSFL
jgi:hypothetical protein